jgi:hypothetical protein
MEEMEALLMEAMAELAERVAMGGMLEMGNEQGIIVLIVLQHILFGFI